jgi:hypothetical protein
MLETLNVPFCNVSNKVLFGDFESDWFDQKFGLKQGCVTKPFLYSDERFSQYAIRTEFRS